MIEFLFWFFLCGIITACIQDLRRTEVDNWLNFLLFAGGSAFLVFSAIFNLDYWILIYGVFSLGVLFIAGNIIYYSKIFAGGDYKLLLAMFAFFAGGSIFLTLENIGVFIFLLFLSGSVWGIGVFIFLYVRNFSSINKKIKYFFKNKYVAYSFMACFVLFVLGYINFIFFIVSIFLFLGVLLFIFAKSIEKTLMIKNIKTSDLREGDWLVSDIKIGNRKLKSDFEGLSKKDILFLKKFKNKTVKIKQGIPFVPAFLISFLIFYFFRDWLFEFFRVIFS